MQGREGGGAPPSPRSRREEGEGVGERGVGERGVGERGEGEGERGETEGDDEDPPKRASTPDPVPPTPPTTPTEGGSGVTSTVFPERQWREDHRHITQER